MNLYTQKEYSSQQELTTLDSLNVTRTIAQFIYLTHAALQFMMSQKTPTTNQQFFFQSTNQIFFQTRRIKWEAFLIFPNS